MRGGGRIIELVDRVSIRKLAQPDELEDPLPPVQRQLGCPAGDQQMPELSFTKQVIELGRRLINHEHNEYPELDRDEVMPIKRRNHVRQECPKWMVFHQPEPDPVFEQARDKHDGPVESRFEQDRPDQRCAIVAADRSRRVGDQYGFSDDERSAGNKHEAAERRTVIGNQQVRRQQDQAKADEKEDRRRQHFAQLAQQEDTDPAHNPAGCRSCLDGRLELGGLISVQNRRALHSPLLKADLICNGTQQPADLRLDLVGIANSAKRANRHAALKPSIKTIKWLSCATAAFHRCRRRGATHFTICDPETALWLNRRTLGYWPSTG